MRPLRARLRKPLEKVVAAGHPWVYRDALEPFDAPPGREVVVETRGGRFLARGFAEAGPLAVRVLSTRDEPLDATLLRARLDHALALRDTLDLGDTDALRLVHGEGDRLPGLVVDRYGRVGVVKLDGRAYDGVLPTLLDVLRDALAPRGIDTLVLRRGKREEATVSLASGTLPDGLHPVRERGMTLLCDLMRGQKTGLFLDHRESRARVRALARGRSVLNLYGYTGGFSVAAGLGGAREVTTVDIAKPAIELASETFLANGLPRERHRAVAQDVPEFLGAAGDTRYDVVVADPPNFAPNERSLEAALESYRKLHEACLARVSAGGFYLAASCSSHVDVHDFDRTLREAALVVRRPLQMLERWGAPADHPRLAVLPESDYLKVVLLRVG